MRLNGISNSAVYAVRAKRVRHNPKRSYGQNFLVNESVASQIVHQARLYPGDRVLEIGPGTGNLTAELLKTDVGQVLAVEADFSLIEGLRQRFQQDVNAGKLILVAGDATRISIPALLAQQAPKDPPWKVVANLPFNITTSMLRLLLPLGDILSEVFVMLQFEAAQRLVGQRGNSDYRAMSVLVDFYSTATMGMTIHRSAFHPPPHVDCAMVHFHLKQENERLPVPSEDQFLRFVDTCFSCRRKTVRNSLRQAYELDAVDAAVGALDLDQNVRPQALRARDFAALCSELSRKT